MGENDEVLFHHRMATSTPDVRNACHPFSTKNAFANQYIGIHNGVITNSYQLKDIHKALGIEYVSNQPPVGATQYVKFNDSEALIFDLARYFEGEVDELTATGNDAFIVLKKDPSGKPTKLFFGHNSGNPLMMKLTKNSLTLSSVGEGKAIPTDTLHIWDYETHELRTVPMKIPMNNWSQHRYVPKQQETTSRAYENSHESMLPSAPVSSSGQSSRLGQHGRWSQSEIDDTFDNYSADDNFESDITDDDELAIEEMLSRDSENYTLPLDDYFGYNDGEFIIRLGTKKSLKEALIRENYKNIAGAAISAEGLFQGANEEMIRINGLAIIEHDEFKLTELVNYYVLVEDYAKLMKTVSMELYQAAKKSKEREAKRIAASKEDSDLRVMGFHGTIEDTKAELDSSIKRLSTAAKRLAS